VTGVVDVDLAYGELRSCGSVGFRCSGSSIPLSFLLLFIMGLIDMGFSSSSIQT